MSSRLRNELKFVIGDHKKSELLRALASYIERDPNYDQCGTEINSLYFETPTHSTFHEKADGLEDRWKARARSYYSLLNREYSSDVFLEIKHRNQGYIRKERDRVSADSFKSFLKGSISDEIERSVFFRKVRSNTLLPAIKIQYIREAYFLKNHPEVRLTFDHKLRYGNPRTWGQKKLLHPFLESHKCIFEVKAYGKIPSWVSSVCSSHNLTPISYSKYAIGFANMNSRQGWGYSL